MNNKQNDILDEMRAEALKETPLGKLLDILADIYGDIPNIHSIDILSNFILKIQLATLNDCRKAVLKTNKNLTKELK